VVTFLTRDQGLITALAKNARQSVRRFGGNLLSPGMAAWYYFRQRPGRDLAFVERGEANPLSPALPSDPICSALAAWALELARAFEVHGNPASASVSLLLRHLAALARTADFRPPALEPRRLSLGFSKCYLELSGFAPSLDVCHLCGRTSSDIWHWDPVIGGVVCQDCQDMMNRGTARMPEGLLAALRATSAHDGCPQLDEAQLLAAELFFQSLASLHAGRAFKSRKVLYELLAGR
jgi:DNA repair protein RecO (recombination protein O)